MQNHQFECPYEGCGAHGKNIVSIGFSRPVDSSKGLRRRRLRCKACGKTFSDNVIKLSFRLRHPDPALNFKIFRLCMHGLSNRKISRILHVSEHSVRLRIERMAQRALEFQHLKSSHLPIMEPLAFDGLENFASSQYEPNNIQQAIGRDSLFIYDFNFATLNRKGRTSVWQKQKLEQIVEKFGRFNPQNIKLASIDIFNRLASRAPPAQKIMLLSDEHYHYRKALASKMTLKKFEHLTISSRACRNYQNILFSVNHADLLIRQSLAAFARETISFAKTHGRMCQRYSLFMVFKNYMSPMFTKKQRRRANAHRFSPAQQLGITSKVLEFTDIFNLRSLEHKSQELCQDWQYFWRAQVPPQYCRSIDFK